MVFSRRDVSWYCASRVISGLGVSLVFYLHRAESPRRSRQRRAAAAALRCAACASVGERFQTVSDQTVSDQQNRRRSTASDTDSSTRRQESHVGAIRTRCGRQLRATVRGIGVLDRPSTAANGHAAEFRRCRSARQRLEGLDKAAGRLHCPRRRCRSVDIRRGRSTFQRL